MKIQIFEEGMFVPTEKPDTQQQVIEFDGTFEEYKAAERKSLAVPMEDIEIMEVADMEDGTLVVNYIAVRMNRKWIRQTHRPV